MKTFQGLFFPNIFTTSMSIRLEIFQDAGGEEKFGSIFPIDRIKINMNLNHLDSNILLYFHLGLVSFSLNSILFHLIYTLIFKDRFYFHFKKLSFHHFSFNTTFVNVLHALNFPNRKK